MSTTSSTVLASTPIQSTSTILENYVGTTTNSTNFDNLNSLKVQPPITNTYNVPPPLPIQHLINFNVPPPVINNLPLPSTTLLPPPINRNGVEIWAPNSNVILSDMSAPPPLIINSQQIPQTKHQIITSTTNNQASPASNDLIVSTDLLPPPGASSASSSSTSPSSSSNDSGNSKNNKINLKKANELNSVWETLLKRTEGVIYIYIYFSINNF